MAKLKNNNKTASISASKLESKIRDLLNKCCEEAADEIRYREDGSSVPGYEILSIVETDAGVDISDFADSIATALTDWQKNAKENYMDED